MVELKVLRRDVNLIITFIAVISSRNNNLFSKGSLTVIKTCAAVAQLCLGARMNEKLFHRAHSLSIPEFMCKLSRGRLWWRHNKVPYTCLQHKEKHGTFYVTFYICSRILCLFIQWLRTPNITWQGLVLSTLKLYQFCEKRIISNVVCFVIFF